MGEEGCGYGSKEWDAQHAEHHEFVTHARVPQVHEAWDV